MLWSSWKLSHHVAPNQALFFLFFFKSSLWLSAPGSALRPGSVAPWSYSGTPVPTTGRTLMSGVNGCSEEVYARLPPSFLPITKPHSSRMWSWLPNSTFQRKLGAASPHPCLVKLLSIKASWQDVITSENDNKHLWIPVMCRALTVPSPSDVLSHLIFKWPKVSVPLEFPFWRWENKDNMLYSGWRSS